MMLTLGILSVILTSCFANSIVETPCRKDQLPCDSTGCISKGRWCDSVVDCSDNSDENYCAIIGKRRPLCKSHHFRCLDHSCIPLNALCDGFSDCEDGSDERKCDGKSNIQNIREYAKQRSRIQSTQPTDVVPREHMESLQRSKGWLIVQQNKDYGWGENSARAVVALALANLQSHGFDGSLIIKKLNVQIATDILRNDSSAIDPSRLALDINALLATCQNPRNFQGLNLVKNLRFQADSLIESNKLVPPLILLTLCLVKETKHSDFNKLHHTFSQEGKKLDLQALTVTAMQCIAKHQRITNDQSNSYMQNSRAAAKILLANYLQNKNARDVYTTALVIQSLNSILQPSEWDSRTESKKLLSHQQDDGSFGDFLSTYYAISALARKNYLSLEDMNCSKIATVESMELPDYRDDLITVVCSLWFGSPVADIHTVSLKVASSWNFFDIMKYAATQKSLFGFKYEDSSDGPNVFSIAGIPNDYEREFYWVPYKQNENVGFRESSVSKIDLMNRPLDGDHLVFWFKHKDDGELITPLNLGAM